MALSGKEQKDGLLEINANDYYFNKLRPFMDDMRLTCHTDEELIRTIDKVINSVDGFCMNKDFDNLIESFDILTTGITDVNYISRKLKNAPEDEKEKVRTLIQMITDFIMIVKYEPVTTKEEPKTRERLSYSSPNGENEDYITHNMEKLNIPNPGKRIPNR